MLDHVRSLQPGTSASQRAAGEEEGSSSGDEGSEGDGMDEDEPMADAAAAAAAGRQAQAERERQLPVVDDDGFELVQRRRR